MNDARTSKQCTVIMTAKTENGKTTLTGTGTYVDNLGHTESYSGKAYVFGDGKTISCDKYWYANESEALCWGGFDANMTGTASISGTVTIDYNSVNESEFTFTDNADEALDGSCFAVLLHGFNEENMDDNAGIMADCILKSDSPYTYTYELKNVPAGDYYIFFVGVKAGNRIPNSIGEALGLYGLTDPDIAMDWIDEVDLTEPDKTTFDAIRPITVSEGDAITKDFTAFVRDRNK